MAILNQKAKRANMNCSQYIREELLNRKVYEFPPIEFDKLIFEMRRIGQNLNRLLQIAYSNGYLDVASIKFCLDEIHSLDMKIHNEFFGLRLVNNNGNDEH